MKLYGVFVTVTRTRTTFRGPDRCSIEKTERQQLASINDSPLVSTSHEGAMSLLRHYREKHKTPFPLRDFASDLAATAKVIAFCTIEARPINPVTELVEEA